MSEQDQNLFPTERRDHWVETLAYSLFAAVALGVVVYVWYFNPVIYTRLVNEDQWGEYGTAIGFGLSGVLFLFLAAKPGPSLRRLFWALIGLAMLLFAGEELSWGKHIFHYSVPDLFHRLNTQDEMTLHNIGPLNHLMRRTAGLLILGWSVFSLLVSLFPRVKNRLENLGIPLIPVKLLFLFLLLPYLFLATPLIKSGEIGELFLAVGMTTWAVDLFLRHALPVVPRKGKAGLIMLGVFLAGALLATAFTMKFQGSMKGTLGKMAVRFYPSRGMYDQAEQIYRYIYEHPRYLEPETRINHGRMLLGLGKREEALQVLREALHELQSGPESREARGEYLRHRGTVQALLGEADLAETDFREAIEVDQRQADMASDPDEKAGYLWSIAQTLEVRGDHTGALNVALQANELAVSGKLRRDLKRKFGFLSDPNAAEEENEL